MNNYYDVVIVGAGPSAVFLAYEMIKLNSKKKVLIIEQGKSVENRKCPIEKTGNCVRCKPMCNITCGFSGAGAVKGALFRDCAGTSDESGAAGGPGAGGIRTDRRAGFDGREFPEPWELLSGGGI